MAAYNASIMYQSIGLSPGCLASDPASCHCAKDIKNDTRWLKYMNLCHHMNISLKFTTFSFHLVWLSHCGHLGVNQMMKCSLWLSPRPSFSAFQRKIFKIEKKFLEVKFQPLLELAEAFPILNIGKYYGCILQSRCKNSPDCCCLPWFSFLTFDEALWT